MKRMVPMLVGLVTSTGLHAQKPVLDPSVYGKWPSVGASAAITHDGKYVLYTIDNQPVGGRTLVLQSTDARWKLEVTASDALEAMLTSDTRRAAFLKSGDSLGVVTLGRTAIEYVSGVRSFKLPRRGSAEWLAYQVSSPAGELVLRNLATGRQRAFGAVADYGFSPDGTALLLTTESGPDSARTQAVRWVRLPDGTPRVIWQGARASNLVFDATGTQLAFLGEGPGTTSPGQAVWYYRAGAASAVRVADDKSAGLERGLVLGDIRGFSRDGRRLFLNLQESASPPSPKPEAVPVHVWSYTDAKLQSQQLRELDPTSMAAFFARPEKNNVTVLRLDDRRLIRLQQEGEHFSYDEDGAGAFGLTEARHGGRGEESWHRGFQGPSFLVSTIDGARKPIRKGATFSPGGKYLIYYDGEEKHFFTYEIASGAIRKLTNGIAADWTVFGNDNVITSSTARGVAGWLPGDAAVVLYDQHDVWQVDPTGVKPPINLTNGYGRRHDIVFSLALADEARRALAPNSRLLLNAFNLRTKDNGFYRTMLGKAGDPERLTMGPYLFDTPSAPDRFSPSKARDAEVYLVRRMQATEAPNYFVTTDFKTLRRLSDLHPERAYNWYRTELHAWTALDGRPTQGILYKPENFDSTQRYPVILHYYQRKSDGLNAYLKPQILGGDGCTIDIPWYVSRWYLVFTPDIHITVGEPGESGVNPVVSAAQYLAKLPWVDAKRMGAQGCSWGGYVTNYLVTRTDLFAAAVSSSGVADFISGYGGTDAGNGASLQGMYELGVWRMGVTLWQRPDLYIKNSPIFRADQVGTPFLMMHTPADGVCPFANAIEFFTALRRLGKRAWLLQYDDGDHGVWSDKSAPDFSLRMAQFFDHYLKGAPAPRWMTRGIPAQLRGVDDGLALDSEIPTPGRGLVADGLATAREPAQVFQP
jgi:dienelactone hydrolase